MTAGAFVGANKNRYIGSGPQRSNLGSINMRIGKTTHRTPNFANATRATLNMGLLDGVKNAWDQGAKKPMVAADRVTPFDRWLGND